uniref:Uncharacterized protein n=1 Tax=Anguilla anguilla TaxID=7936 RepID=A0A0E9RPS2_ANGAN
MSDRQYSL